MVREVFGGHERCLVCDMLEIYFLSVEVDSKIKRERRFFCIVGRDEVKVLVVKVVGGPCDG